MAKLWANLRWTARALMLSGIVALCLAQAFAVAASGSARLDGASAADRLCRSVTHDATHDADADGRPVGGRHHCDMCPAACEGAAAGAAVAPLRLGMVLPYAPPAVAAPRLIETPTPVRSAWNGSWSSRAPPLGA